MATGVDAKLLKTTKFPPEFNQKVDMQKVNLQVMKKWIAGKVTDILGSEDDVVIELVFNLIEGPRHPDIKSLQIQLTGFLDKDTAPFCQELWKLLLSAQTSPQGVPKELLEAKKLELIQEKIEADKAAEAARQRRDEFDRRDRGGGGQRGGRMDSWRGQRDDRGRDSDNRGRGGFRGGRGRSRSPPRYRDRGARGGGGDSYIPRGSPTSRRGRQENRFRDNRRRRSETRSRTRSADSVSSRSRSRSRSSSVVSRRSPSPRSPSPSRRRARTRRDSPSRSRSRSRSPPPASRRRGRRRSVSSDRASPPPKRRRYSSSRSRSRSPRRRRYSRSSSFSSRSSRYSRHSRSLSRSRSPRRTRGRRRSRGRSRSVSTRSSCSRRRRYRRSLTRSSVNSRADSKSPRGDSRGRGRRRERERSQDRRSSVDHGRRANSISSNSQVSRSRDGSADVSAIEDRPQSPHDKSSAPTAGQPPKSAERLANELREEELREQIKKMRSSKSGPSNAEANRP